MRPQDTAMAGGCDPEPQTTTYAQVKARHEAESPLDYINAEGAFVARQDRAYLLALVERMRPFVECADLIGYMEIGKQDVQALLSEITPQE